MIALFGKVCQNGYVVRDIAAAMNFWTEVVPVFSVPMCKYSFKSDSDCAPLSRFLCTMCV